MRRIIGLKGERGFTLVEILVVLAILGVLASVIIPNVAKFIGAGTVQAANAEAHTVQTAVIAGMTDKNVGALDVGCTVGPLRASAVTYMGANSLDVQEYFNGSLQATYTLDTLGSITAADASAAGKWSGLIYTPENGWTKPATP